MALARDSRATTVDSNTRSAILDATEELLGALIERNRIDSADVASVWFTTTPDLDAEFPRWWRGGASTGPMPR